MAAPIFDVVMIGEEIPRLTADAISRLRLALFAGASGDHNPIHVDLDYARSAGLDDVFVHGMLVMAYVGRMLTNWVPQTALRRFSLRFAAITHVHDSLTCSGKIVEKTQHNGERLIRLEVIAANQHGEVKAAGEAIVALP